MTRAQAEGWDVMVRVAYWVGTAVASMVSHWGDRRIFTSVAPRVGRNLDLRSWSRDSHDHILGARWWGTSVGRVGSRATLVGWSELWDAISFVVGVQPYRGVLSVFQEW